MKTHLLLKKYFDRRRKESAGFSLRSLARRLGVSPSFLSRVLSGKRAMPEALQPRLAEALGVEPELLSGAGKGRRARLREAGGTVEEWAIADGGAQRMLRAWYYIPLLELTTLPDCPATIAGMAGRLGLPEYTTQLAVHELESAGLLKQEKGRYRKVEEKLKITSSRPNPLIRKFHDEMLARAQNLLRGTTSEEDLQRRLISGVTITAAPEKVQEAKRKLHDFLYGLANDLLATPGTEVYHLSAQLFPLTDARRKPDAS